MRGVNSVAALRIYLWLARGDAKIAKLFAQRIFERLWVRGMDITNTADLAEVCGAIGIDADAATAAAESAEGKQALRFAVDDAVATGVFGTPYFIIDGEPIWGVDRLWMVEHWLKNKSWDPEQD